MGLGATTGANFLGACCWEMEMLALPIDGVVSILAVTCAVWSLLFPGFHMVAKKGKTKPKISFFKDRNTSELVTELRSEKGPAKPNCSSNYMFSAS